MGRGLIEGYATFFEEADLSGDRVAPGAFRQSLSNKSANDIKFLYQHDPERPLGRWLDVREDARGLFVRGEINTQVQLGREVHALLHQGALEGLSIGFNTLSAARASEPKGGRRLLQIDLWEVSLVTFPMLPSARVRPVAGPPDKAGTPGDDETDAAQSLKTLTQLMRY